MLKAEMLPTLPAPIIDINQDHPYLQPVRPAHPHCFLLFSTVRLGQKQVMPDDAGVGQFDLLQDLTRDCMQRVLYETFP
jgi:hypothetical protein